MYTIDNLKAVILITNFGTNVVVDELSGNSQFKAEIKEYCGFVDDLFFDIKIPDEVGFYEFNGGADCGVDINDNIDEVSYFGEFTKIEGYKFNQ